MDKTPVTAIIVAYNSRAVISGALGPLAADPHIASVIVVDNCSTDDTCELVRRDFPRAVVIENPRNDGYGRACNIGLGKTLTEYALLVNPDATLHEGCIEALLAAAARYPQAAIIAPQLYDGNGGLQHTHKRNVFDRERRRDTYTAPAGDLCAEFLSGAVWLLNMRILKTIGFFDSRIFLYYEDDDLCLRARKAGYELVLAHDARATHLLGVSSGRPKPDAEFFKQKQMAWSRLYLEEKYHGAAAAGKLASKLNLQYGFKAALYCLRIDRRKLNRYRGRLAGVFAFTERAAARRAA